MRRPEPLGATVTALFAASHIAAWALLGGVVHNDLAAHTAASEPDMPTEQPDLPPADAA